jgi:hypothetical protein
LSDISSSGRAAFAAFIEALFPHDIMRRWANERQGCGQEAVAAPTRHAAAAPGDGPGGTKAHWPDCRRGATIGRIMPVQEDTNAAEHSAQPTPPRRSAHNWQTIRQRRRSS